MSERKRIGVLASGAGSNLAALLERAAEASFPGEVVMVLCNRPNAGALKVAANWNIPTTVMTADAHTTAVDRDHALVEALHSARVDVVVCAGWDKVFSAPMLDAFPDAIINVHPSLLPAFGGGLHAIRDALEYGVRVTGCTVHLVAPGETDAGPIILQAAVPIEADDDVESLELRIHEQEWKLLPDAVALWCAGRLVREGRHVRIRNGHPHAVPA